MTLFLSSFENKIDKKGRISVPAPFRMALVNETFTGTILFRSYKFPTIEGCGISRMQRFADALDTMDQFSDDMDDLASTLFADAHQLAFDGDGRIVLPKALMDHAELEEKAIFVGRGATFQLWNPLKFIQHQEEARKRAQEKGATLRLAPLTQKEGG